MASTATSISEYQYTSDAGKKYRIRLSGAVATLYSNSTPVGTLDDGNVLVSVSKHGQKKRYGIKARGLVLGLPAVAPATGYQATTFVAVTDLATWAGVTKGSTVTYAGSPWKVRDKVAEV